MVHAATIKSNIKYRLEVSEIPFGNCHKITVASKRLMFTFVRITLLDINLLHGMDLQGYFVNVDVVTKYQIR